MHCFAGMYFPNAAVVSEIALHQSRHHWSCLCTACTSVVRSAAAPSRCNISSDLVVLTKVTLCCDMTGFKEKAAKAAQQAYDSTVQATAQVQASQHCMT